MFDAQTEAPEYRASIKTEITIARDALFLGELTAKENTDWSLAEVCRSNRLALESILGGPLIKF